MADIPEIFDHPVFGHVRWDTKLSQWRGCLTLATGKRIDVIANPRKTEPLSFLDQAGQQFSKVIDAEARVLQDTLNSELLELYNENWRQEGD